MARVEGGLLNVGSIACLELNVAPLSIAEIWLDCWVVTPWRLPGIPGIALVSTVVSWEQVGFSISVYVFNVAVFVYFTVGMVNTFASGNISRAVGMSELNSSRFIACNSGQDDLVSHSGSKLLLEEFIIN